MEMKGNRESEMPGLQGWKRTFSHLLTMIHKTEKYLEQVNQKSALSWGSNEGLDTPPIVKASEQIKVVPFSWTKWQKESGSSMKTW